MAGWLCKFFLPLGSSYFPYAVENKSGRKGLITDIWDA
jgi:hypothetical protein